MSTDVLPETFTGFVDDAATFPPGDVPMTLAVAAFEGRTSEWYADFAPTFVCTDVGIPSVTAAAARPPRVSVLVTGGAGAIAGACRLAARGGHELAGLELALRDLDDLPGNARRTVAALDAALAEGLLEEETRIFVELPPGPPTPAWLAAADEVAMAGLRLKFRTGGVEERLFPTTTELASWISAALDRETPFKCTAGLHHAARNTGEGGWDHHGFLNVLVATIRAFDGASDAEVAETLAERDAVALAGAVDLSELARGRRWFTSFGCCDVLDPLRDLIALGLVSPPAGADPL